MQPAFGRPGNGDRGVVLEDAKTDALRLVSKRGGTLELEVASRLAHLGLELGDQLLDLLPAQFGERPPIAGTVSGRILGHRAQAVVDVSDLLDDRGRLDAVLDVVRLLDRAAPVRLIDGDLHRLRHPIGVHDDLAPDVAGGPADDLDERPGAAQEALLVRIEDGHQGDLGQVDALAQEVDADEDVEDADA